MLENNNYIDLRNYNSIILIVFISTLIIVLGLLIYKNYYLSINNNLLTNLNSLFQDTINKNNIQLREIHHRIKNNLQLIVSLLNIEAQSENINSIESFLLKGQTRIHSIAAFHQNLYESENINLVNLQEYFENIAQHLHEIYNKNITFEINANNVFLEVEKAIPVGLIITELVYNAFKHAFVENNEGNILIEIKKNNQNKFELTLKDNGIGFPEKPTPKISIGLDLVSLMVLQINGKLVRKNQQGALFNISF